MLSLVCSQRSNKTKWNCGKVLWPFFRIARWSDWMSSRNDSFSIDSSFEGATNDDIVDADKQFIEDAIARVERSLKTVSGKVRSKCYWIVWAHALLRDSFRVSSRLATLWNNEELSWLGFSLGARQISIASTATEMVSSNVPATGSFIKFSQEFWAFFIDDPFFLIIYAVKKCFFINRLSR